MISGFLSHLANFQVKLFLLELLVNSLSKSELNDLAYANVGRFGSEFTKAEDEEESSSIPDDREEISGKKLKVNGRKNNLDMNDKESSKSSEGSGSKDLRSEELESIDSGSKKSEEDKDESKSDVLIRQKHSRKERKKLENFTLKSKVSKDKE